MPNKILENLKVFRIFIANYLKKWLFERRLNFGFFPFGLPRTFSTPSKKSILKNQESREKLGFSAFRFSLNFESINGIFQTSGYFFYRKIFAPEIDKVIFLFSDQQLPQRRVFTQEVYFLIFDV